MGVFLTQQTSDLPEPGSLALFAVGLGALSAARRRRGWMAHPPT